MRAFAFRVAKNFEDFVFFFLNFVRYPKVFVLRISPSKVSKKRETHSFDDAKNTLRFSSNDIRMSSFEEGRRVQKRLSFVEIAFVEREAVRFLS